MKAYLKNNRQTPRKVRSVVDLVKGKYVADADNILTYTKRKSAVSLKNLIKSAVANAENLGKNKDKLYIKSILVDEGIKFRRFRPVGKGRTQPYKLRSSHIKVVLEEK